MGISLRQKMCFRSTYMWPHQAKAVRWVYIFYCESVQSAEYLYDADCNFRSKSCTPISWLLFGEVTYVEPSSKTNRLGVRKETVKVCNLLSYIMVQIAYTLSQWITSTQSFDFAWWLHIFSFYLCLMFMSKGNLRTFTKTKDRRTRITRVASRNMPYTRA